MSNVVGKRVAKTRQQRPTHADVIVRHRPKSRRHVMSKTERAVQYDRFKDYSERCHPSYGLRLLNSVLPGHRNDTLRGHQPFFPSLLPTTHHLLPTIGYFRIHIVHFRRKVARVKLARVASTLMPIITFSIIALQAIVAGHLPCKNT